MCKIKVISPERVTSPSTLNTFKTHRWQTYQQQSRWYLHKPIMLTCLDCSQYSVSPLIPILIIFQLYLEPLVFSVMSLFFSLSARSHAVFQDTDEGNQCQRPISNGDRNVFRQRWLHTSLSEFMHFKNASVTSNGLSSSAPYFTAKAF